MIKQIEDYTEDELSAKIEAIKAEREKTANALKRYEKELERRKQEVPLGVPVAIDDLNEMFYSVSGTNEVWNELRRRYGVHEQLLSALNMFHSKESAEKHAEMLLDWRKALFANSKGEQIDIKVLFPLLKKGWVAMDKNGDWYWFKEKPYIEKYYYSWNTGSPVSFIGGFNIKPAENWEESLMECGL